MNENTCTLEKEMRRALLEKLEQNYLNYAASLQALTSEQLLDRTKEIYAAQVCCRLVQRRDDISLPQMRYLVEDKTHSAIMLTGAWGTGKSYYIQNELVPFLKEEHEKECVTLSLYGIKSTAEISRSIYIELRAKTLSAKGEAAVAGKLIAKTIVRGVVSRFGIDFSKENDTMQELYESINLSNKLVILEDIERSQIEVIELLGYVNSLVEQDNVKVLLVANENEML